MDLLVQVRCMRLVERYTYIIHVYVALSICSNGAAAHGSHLELILTSEFSNIMLLLLFGSITANSNIRVQDRRYTYFSAYYILWFFLCFFYIQLRDKYLYESICVYKFMMTHLIHLFKFLVSKFKFVENGHENLIHRHSTSHFVRMQPTLHTCAHIKSNNKE